MAVKPQSVGYYLQTIWPELNESSPFPRWPPDAFCLSASLLQRSGAYTTLVNDKPPNLTIRKNKDRNTALREIAKTWRDNATGKGSLPKELINWWRTLQEHFSLPVSQITQRPICTAALLQIMAAADEASAGVGISVSGPLIRPEWSDINNIDHFLAEAELQLLKTSEKGSTLCQRIDPSRARVLPKMHTAQSGLTMRSFSHNLACCATGDLKPQWYSFATDTQEHALNLLILPWPLAISPSQFAMSRKVHLTDSVDRGGYGMFTFAAEAGPKKKYIEKIVNDAENYVGRVDGLVFPEMALSPTEYANVSKWVVNQRRFLVAGVGTKAVNDRGGKNYVGIDMVLPGSSLKVSLQQNKHHRWKLTKSQIVQYGIGTNLHPEANWWEHISLSNRKLMFISLRPWLTMCTLVCEDLARPDPVGDIVRSVGPNLVIALLMDGPQLGARWPGRYATALADDPGSSVLTVTSLGMSRMSQPISGPSRARVVALWKDARTGITKELELPEGAKALILNITVEYQEEWTVDKRGDGGVSGYPILAGFHPIY